MGISIQNKHLCVPSKLRVASIVEKLKISYMKMETSQTNETNFE